MKCTLNILAGLALLLLSLPVNGEIIIDKFNNSITVTSTKEGTKGFRGCEKSSLEEAPAYFFELQFQKTRKPESVCSAGNLGSWVTHSKLKSEKATVVFENLAKGNYRVFCLSGEAIGCQIEGSEDQSIIYAKELSKIIDLNVSLVNSQDVSEQFNKSQTGGLNIYPNPASNEVNIQLENRFFKNKVTLTLVDLLGQTILSKETPIDENLIFYNWTFKVVSLPAGTYFINIVDEEGRRLQEKVIILND